LRRALLATTHGNAFLLLIPLLGHFAMYLVVIAWLYVVFIAAVAEATSSIGTVLGAVITFVLYGLLPLSIVMFILGTPGRKRAIYAKAMAERAALAAAEPTSVAPDADGKAPTGESRSAAPAVRKEA
jgi:hypothetical protein